MQRGPYELGKPVITSNTGILRESFHKGVVFVDNSVISMVNGIVEMRLQIEKYRAEVQLLKQEELKIWDTTRREMLTLLENHSS